MRAPYGLSHQYARLLHGLCRWLFPPNVRAEVISPQHYVFEGKSPAVRQFSNESRKIRGLLPGVPPKLIDLIRRRFDKQETLILLSSQYSRFQNVPVRRTDRKNSSTETLPILLQDVPNLLCRISREVRTFLFHVIPGHNPPYRSRSFCPRSCQDCAEPRCRITSSKFRTSATASNSFSAFSQQSTSSLVRHFHVACRRQTSQPPHFS